MAAHGNPRCPGLPVFGTSREKLSQILTARAKMAVAGSPYGQQRNSVVCALIGGEEGRGCILIGRFWQPPARICTASLGTLRDRLWAGQWEGRIPPTSHIWQRLIAARYFIFDISQPLSETSQLSVIAHS